MTIERLMKLLKKCPLHARVVIAVDPDGERVLPMDELKYSSDWRRIPGILARSASYVILLPAYPEE